MRRAVLMTRQAISPRLAIRIRLNMGLLICNLWAGSSPPLRTGAAIWHAGTDVTIPSYSKTKQRQRLICRKSLLRGDNDAPLDPITVRWHDRAVRRHRICTEQRAP